MTDLTDDQVQALLDGATPGPWRADGEPWNRIVWSSADNRVCFMAHSSGLNDARDIATSNLVAAAPDLARALLDARAELAATQTQVGDWIVRADEANVKVETLDAELARVRADAQAAVARAYEAAAERLDLAEHDAEERDWRSGANAFAALAKGLRALAPADGLAAVDALRAEIADLKMNMDADLRTMVREGQQLRTLATELAAAQQREARLRAALEYYADTFCEGFCKDLPQAGTYQPEMDLDCSGCKARAALAPTPTDPGDGWTWNERLGWIDLDGKPADPRRRG
jgi:hypothetical protein